MSSRANIQGDPAARHLTHVSGMPRDYSTRARHDAKAVLGKSEFENAIDVAFVDEADSLRAGGFHPDLTQTAVDVQWVENVLKIQPDVSHPKLAGRQM